MSPRRRAARRPSRRALVATLAAGAVALGTLAWVAVSMAGRDDAAPGTASDDPGVSHVHGLGINPADGSLVVATHFGSFRIAEDGEAHRIGDSFQDTMGFTVAGPDHFLGSGHPDVEGTQAGQPPQLGLIESTDGGATWTILSLGGEADFHAIAIADDRVYGWDAGTGRFMVSSDRRQWETRSSLDLAGFAVDPDDTDHLVGAVPDGLSESTDGGRNWRPVDGPALVTVSWDTSAGLWGADAAGAVWHRGARGWARAGQLPGQPQAFLATADALYAAAHDADGRTGIYRSSDGGRTWHLRYRDPSR